MTDTGLLRIPQVCQQLGVKRTTIYNLRKEGRLVPIKIRGAVVYRQPDVDRFVAALAAEQGVEPTASEGGEA